MIFVSAGTHEQYNFDRVVRCADEMARNTAEEVFIQYGYGTYLPRHARGAKLLELMEFGEMVQRARIVITHGGPGNIYAVLGENKIPVVVPRWKRYGEAGNDHQVEFCRELAKKGYVIPVYDIAEMPGVVENYVMRMRHCKIGDNSAVGNRRRLGRMLNMLVG